MSMIAKYIKANNLACYRCRHFGEGEEVFYCAAKMQEFPAMCIKYDTTKPGDEDESPPVQQS